MGNLLAELLEKRLDPEALLEAYMQEAERREKAAEEAELLGYDLDEYLELFADCDE